MPGIADAISSASNYQQGAVAMQQKTSAGIDQALSDYRERMQRADTEEASLNPDALTPPTLSQPPQPKPTNPVQEWGSAAMWVAALSGVFTRQHATASINAMTGVLNAYKQQDATAAQQAYDTWKIANENTIKSAKTTVDAYKSALAQIKTDRDAAKADVLAVAAALKDETIPYVMEHYGMDAVVRLVDQWQNHVDRMDSAQPKIDELQAKIHAQTNYVTAARALKAAQDSGDKDKIAQAQADFQEAGTELAAFGSGSQAGIQPLDDAAAEDIAEAYVAGDHTVMQSLGYGNVGAANRTRVWNHIETRMKDLGMTGEDLAAAKAEFMGTQAGERTLGTTAARIGLGAAEMETLIPQVQAASAKLPRGSFPTMNAMIQYMQAQTGDPDLRSLAVRLQGLKSAYSQVLTRGGVPTDSARAAADELFSTKDPQAVLDTAIAAIKQETAAIKKAPGIVRDELRSQIGGRNRGYVGPWKADPSWPSAKGVPDGHLLTDLAGDVVAKAEKGKWVEP